MSEPVWIEAQVVQALHEKLLALNGGPEGVRDEHLLHSALARPQQHFAYGETIDIPSLATVYTAGIVRNHSFVDGNKRTGFVVGILFLEMNGYDFTASEAEAAAAVLALAAHELEEVEYAAFLKANVRPS